MTPIEPKVGHTSGLPVPAAFAPVCVSSALGAEALSTCEPESCPSEK
jgi:hypothetical protein